MNSFAIYLFAFDTLGDLGQTQESVWTALQHADLTKNTYVITESLIAYYDWEDQSFGVRNSWVAQNEATPGFMRSSSYFVVVFNERRLFGGRLVPSMTAEVITYPVMLATPEAFAQDITVLEYAFRPQTAAFYNPPFRFLADDSSAAVRSHLQATGKLKE